MVDWLIWGSVFTRFRPFLFLGATAAVSRFVEDLKTTENYVNELEDEFDNMAPPAKDLGTLMVQIDEVARFEENIDATAKEVRDAELALGDLVDRHYSVNADGWKDQIDTMFDQLESLVLRSQHRTSDLVVAKEKLEEFQNTLANVMQSLAQDGEEGGMDLPVDGHANYIHEQVRDRSIDWSIGWLIDWLSHKWDFVFRFSVF